jgi:hypothetical protein
MHQVSKIFILSRNSTCFGHLLCPSSGVISCTRGNWYVSCRLEPDSPWQRPHNLNGPYQLPRAQLITPDDGQSRCPKHVEFRDKIKILGTWWILLVIYTKIITMHGHLNIKCCLPLPPSLQCPQLFYFILGLPIRVSLHRAKRNELNSPQKEGTAITSSLTRSVISGFCREAYEIFDLLGYYVE